MNIKSSSAPKAKKFKTPKISEQSPDILKRPVFSFMHLQRQRHVKELDKEKQVDLVIRLCKLSELTWDQLRKCDRHGLGYEIITADSLKFSLPSEVKGQTILAFRYSGKHAMVGFRESNIFHILGLDKDFNPNCCYDHGK